ncbi:hypothetical protein KNE206_50750 [Kitasatospora sp. NE20-6]|uniref:M23 family metallopeptidase n=1 Tax=Kitasatospora sp. NE20-6 TaxID=2859066 RepID=UPI0034DC7FFD
MASTHSAEPTAAATQLLDHPREQADQARHRMPRQTRGTSPLFGVTATMAATFGAAGLTAAAAGPAAAAEPAVSAPDEAADTAADPGLALAARIQQQADNRRTAADEAARLAAAQEAEARRAAQAAVDDAALALPTTGYTLGTPYGQSSTWAHLYTGLDFEAPAGTPVTAVAAGTVTSAGWAGSYGYRVVQTLPDGTEIWYCHLSRLAATDGRAERGAVLGAVGATGTVTTARLHLEVRPGGGAPVDPLGWLRSHGVQP